MLILGIETSCDETSAAVVRDGRDVISNVIASSVKDHAEFGGVFPEVAARRQIEFIIPVIDQALKEATITHNDLDAIAVTRGPGLLTSLLVGTTAARTFASVWKKPLIGVHHTLGHLSSPWLECEEEIKFPILSLSVSGGHTELWYRVSHTRGQLLGRTRDDAAGEAFDKGAAMLGLPYPGGPAISALAEGGNPHYAEFAVRRSEFERKSADFSFSGLKTGLKYYIRDRGGLDAQSDAEKKDIAASYQEAICEHLVSRVERGLKIHEVHEIHLVGGVACNAHLRLLLKNTFPRTLTRIPNPIYCTDNAAMIAAAGEFLLEEQPDKATALFSTEASVLL